MTDLQSNSTPQDPKNQSASDGCEEFIHAKIRSANTISFAEFMQLALYSPKHGYYSSGQTRVGKQGDFYTSVSVGPAFGSILASRILDFWNQIGQPSSFTILEIGANDAALADDILTALKSTPLYDTVHYKIIEPLTELRQKQTALLQDKHHDKVEIVADASSLPSFTGVFLSNELFDAFPVDLLSYRNQRWQQLHLGLSEGSLTKIWRDLPADSEIDRFASGLGTEFPDSYTTEYRAGLDTLAEQINQTLERGLIIAIDYGFPRSHYYHPSRTEGTLQTYYQHQKDDDPFSQPGQKDITAHVDFTQLAEAFSKHGFELADFSPQHRYLTQHGKKWLLEIEQAFSPASLPLIQQFQTLTHPGMMGRQFHVLEMIKNIDSPIQPTTQNPAEVLELK